MAAASLLPSLPELPMSATRHNIFHCYCFVNRVEAATLSSTPTAPTGQCPPQGGKTHCTDCVIKKSPGLQVTLDLAVMPDHSIPAPAGGRLFFYSCCKFSFALASAFLKEFSGTLSRLLPRFLKSFQARFRACFRVSNKLFKTRFRDFFLASYKFFQARFRASFTLFTSFLRLVPRFFRAFSSLLCDLQSL